MAKMKKSKGQGVGDYRRDEAKRKNNPPAGVVLAEGRHFISVPAPFC